ncbi:MAG: sensor histidine kinase, partial [Terriglobales bacterium]
MQTSSNPDSREYRVLVMTPTGRDGRLICELLDRVSIPCQNCESWERLLSEIRSGAGAVIIAEEALTPALIETLSGLIKDQPPWSDFPLLLLTVAGAVSTSSLRRLEMQKPLGNVLLLERPIRPETLVSTVRGALRARRRQYQIREQLHQQQQAEEALRKSEKLAIAGRMAASIAHEINNPLESVTNLVYLSATSEHLHDIRSYLETAQQELARVSAITTHTLRFYREPAGPGPVNVTEILDSVLLLFCSRLNYANVTVDRCCEQVPSIVGLAGELRQVFANLVGNALDAMRSGGTLKVRVRSASELNNGRRSGVRVIIADTGQGISPDKQAKIFEPFFTTKGQTGTGLGLWISSEIIQKHRGTVRLKSSVRPKRSGTVFSIF